MPINPFTGKPYGPSDSSNSRAVNTSLSLTQATGTSLRDAGVDPKVIFERSLQSQPYFWGKLSSKEATSALANRSTGRFFIYQDDTDAGYHVAVSWKGKVTLYRFQLKDRTLESLFKKIEAIDKITINPKKAFNKPDWLSTCYHGVRDSTYARNVLIDPNHYLVRYSVGHNGFYVSYNNNGYVIHEKLTSRADWNNVEEFVKKSGIASPKAVSVDDMTHMTTDRVNNFNLRLAALRPLPNNFVRSLQALAEQQGHQGFFNPIGLCELVCDPDYEISVKGIVHLRMRFDSQGSQHEFTFAIPRSLLLKLINDEYPVHHGEEFRNIGFTYKKLTHTPSLGMGSRRQA